MDGVLRGQGDGAEDDDEHDEHVEHFLGHDPVDEPTESEKKYSNKIEHDVNAALF